MSAKTAPIQELIQRLRNGSEDAAVELVQRYEVEMRREVRMRMRDRNLRSLLDTTDVCQSVFASFFFRVSLGQFDLESPQDLGKLLCRMVRNKVVDQTRRNRALRRDGRKTVSFHPDMPQATVADSEPPPVDQVAIYELITECRMRLDADDLQIADLRIAGKTWGEIGSDLGRTPNAVRKQLDRAVTKVSLEMGLTEV